MMDGKTASEIAEEVGIGVGAALDKRFEELTPLLDQYSDNIEGIKKLIVELQQITTDLERRIGDLE